MRYTRKDHQHLLSARWCQWLSIWCSSLCFFGLIANWGNRDITFANLEILFFKNWFFNVNLLLMLLGRLALHYTKQPVKLWFGPFTPDMIILHISIIAGGLLLFFVVRRYPHTFSPANLWGSVIIILPFLVIKMLAQWRRRDAVS